jgi:NUMOD3 motif
MNHPNGKPVSIYALKDPVTDEIRYIGWAITPGKRLMTHIAVSRSGKEKNHRANWIRSLLARGLAPKLHIIESGVTDFAEREIFWIAHYRALGCRLTNGTDGGEGMVGWIPSDETKQKLSTRMKGRKGFFTGGKHTESAKRKMSAARRLRVTKPETREKLSVAMKRRVFRPESREKMSRTQRAATAVNPKSAQYRLENGLPVGRWTLLERIPGPINKWKCRCKCGSIGTPTEQNLARGGSLSCGCLQFELTAAAHRTHNESGNTVAGKSVEYAAWQSMRAACNIPTGIRYATCGALGVIVCERWNSYEFFLSDMGRKPSPRHGLMRWPDRSGNYEPGNVKWASKREQISASRTPDRLFSLNGRSMILVAWCEEFSASFSLVWRRLRRGWDLHRALTTPNTRKSAGLA